MGVTLEDARAHGGPPSHGAPRMVARLAERLSRFDRSTLQDIYMAFEATCILVIGIVLLETYVGGALDVPNHRLVYAAPIALGLAAIVLSLRSRGLYDFARLARFAPAVGDVLLALARAFAILVVVGFALNVANEFSRIWVIGWFASIVPVVLLARAFAARLIAEMTSRGHVLRRVAVQGPGARAEAVAEHLRRAGTGVGVTGLFETDASPVTLIEHVRTRGVDAVVVVMDPHAPHDVEGVVSALSVLPVEIRLHIANRAGAVPFGMTDADGLRSFAVQGVPLSRRARLTKAVMDRGGAALLLVALSPLLAVVALAVRLDSPGPVIFRQRRHGFNRREFRVWKFRTMSVTEDGDAFVQAHRDDARVTRIGHFLRRTSIDELPQLVNVVKGEMSLVGPRPHPISMDAQYEAVLEHYAGRQKVKPGITGLAQINGLRGPTPDDETMRRRLEQDLHYIENWSPWLDIRILAATPFLGIVNRNAF